MYNAVHSLDALRDQYSIHTSVSGNQLSGLKHVDLFIGEKKWALYLDDEYGDLNNDRQLMCLYLVLKELKVYQSQTDFLKWCGQNGGKPNDSQLLDYYRQLGRNTFEIESLLGAIDTQISDLDYQLRTGVITELLMRA